MNRYVFPAETREVLEGLKQPFAVYQTIDGQVVTLLVSDGFCELLGYGDRGQAVYDMDHDMYKDTHPDDVRRATEAAVRFASGSDDYDIVYRTRAGVDSDYRVIHAHGKHVCPEEGVRLAHVWYTDEGLYIEGDEFSGTRMNRELNSILHEESILRAANYDALTGLPNLAYFFKLCEIEKARIFRKGEQGCLLYMDLYGMKYYNHRMGFSEGDRLLKAFSELLVRTFGLEHCCHIGADRFAVSTTENGLEDRLRRFFDEAEQMKEHLPVLVGIYSTAMEDVPVSSAYDRAKMACDTIRKTDRSCFAYYNQERRDAARLYQYIRTNIDRAISEKWIQVYYQPIVRALNGKVCEEEALARWNDPAEGFLSPADFVPRLEAAGQIYKLDLYVLEQVLEKIRRQAKAGMNAVPQSINLSRSDFETCDIVEEIRKRVDEAGIRRDMITIEITESVIGSDVDYIRSQVGRFRELGFPVWLDDFGTGYSSLDVLQSMQFDLIKFDMSFMRKLHENESSRIILTELMKLAASIGVDTVCEGVETEEQVRFLQEIGCSKLQGFYFSKPLPFEQILERVRSGPRLGFEDPSSSSYYETIGRINLYDLGVIASRDDNFFQNSFNTIPIAIMEIRGDSARLVRYNPSYGEFIDRFFDLQDSPWKVSFTRFDTPFLDNIVRNCREQGSRTVFDEKMQDGSVVHSFARRIGTNPKTGDMAIAVAVFSISDASAD